MDMYSVLSPILDINEVVILLKNKNILYTNNNIKTFFMLKKQKIIITNANMNITLTIDEFKNLYDGNKFFIYEDNDENFDFSRDIEYYSWKHK